MGSDVLGLRELGPGYGDYVHFYRSEAKAGKKFAILCVGREKHC